MIEEQNPEPELLRIASISVEGLFGLYDHTIPLNLEDRVTIIHGPNGVGKTKLLAWIEALFRLDHSVFLDVPFRRFRVDLDNGASIEVEPLIHNPAYTVPVAPSQTESETHHGALDEPVLSFRGRDPDGTTHEYGILPAAPNTTEIGLIWRSSSNSSDKWFEKQQDRQLSMADALSVTLSQKWIRRRSSEPPPWLTDTTQRVDVLLIETQRLIQERTPSSRSITEKEKQFVPAVEEYARKLHRIIREELAEYANTSQVLDQTFPQRLLAFPSTEIDVQDLKRRMVMLDKTRTRLAAIGLLQDEGPGHPFDVSTLDNLEKEKRIVLAVYVENTEAKFKTLDGFAEHLGLFLDNLNEKFDNKRLRIDPKQGLVAEDDNGHPLNLSNLSSGEQHEIVLLYDLLFNVHPNTLVLIDEPELSLHITWQKRFLDDLLQVAKTVGLDTLVATHSPFIIGDREDLMVALKAATQPSRLASE